MPNHPRHEATPTEAPPPEDLQDGDGGGFESKGDMNFTSAYDVGDIVFAAVTETKQVWIECPDCLGEQWWDAKTPAGEELRIECPTCRYGYETKGVIYDYELTGEVKRLTIADVSLRDREFRYMAKESGFPSGASWGESELFASREAAEAALPGRLAEHRHRIDENEARRNYKGKGAKAADDTMYRYYSSEARKHRRELKRCEEIIQRYKRPAEATQ